MKSNMFYADMTPEEWEQIRQLAEDAINNDMYEKCPVKCVVNAYVTWLMTKRAKNELLDEEYIH